MPVFATFRVDIQFSAGVWTDVSEDVIIADGMRTSRGISGSTPRDRVAGTGTFEFYLNNSARNSAALEGYYSPAHTNCRAGWTFGVPVRLVATYSAVEYPLWRGRVRTINPLAGKFRTRRVAVTAQDCMGEMAEAILREITPQLNKSETSLISTIVAAVPTDAQPHATSLDNPVDVFPYALDNAGDGASALALLNDTVTSAFGYLYPLNDGTLRYTNRRTWQATSTSGTLGETEMTELEVPSSRENVYNKVRVTAHPKRVTEEANVVLWRADTIVSVPAGESQTIWATYADPDNPQKLSGGANINPAVAGSNYSVNSSPSGLGTNLSASVAVTVTGFASTAKIEIVNSSGVTAYFAGTDSQPHLTVVGRGVYDNAPITRESYTATTYADRTFDFDLPYQDDANIAQDIADYIKLQYLTTARKATSVTIAANNSNTLMLKALQREIGQRETLTETMTGLTSVQQHIVGIALEIKAPNILTCRWTLAPALTQQFFTLNSSTLAPAGTHTLGYV